MSQDGHKSQALLVEEFGISRLKVRKILITTGDMHYPETVHIQQLLASGMKKTDACEHLNMAISTLNSFLPYTHNIINLSETENLVTVMWANEMFDPNHPDTFFEIV